MISLTGTDKLDWVSPLDAQRVRKESSLEIVARATALRSFGHWGLAEVLDDEASMREMLEGKIAAVNAEKHEEIMVYIPKRIARLVAAEARESNKQHGHYVALGLFGEQLYKELGL